MSTSVQRKDLHLDEAIDILNVYYEEAEHNAIAAYASLPKSMQEFVDAEMESCLEPRYYLENYHVINSKTEGFKTLYPFWDSQEIFIAKVYRLLATGKAIKAVVLKARQLGLSTLAEALLFHRTIFNEGCNSLVVAQVREQADYLFEMARFAYDYLPWWMRPERRYDAKGRYQIFDRSDPNVRMSNPGLRSQILVDYANKAGGIAGVGKTLMCVHVSEYSSFDNPGILTEGIFPTMTSNAMGIIESTARGRRNPFHDFWRSAIEGDSEWIPVFIESFRIKDYFIPVSPKEGFQLTADEQLVQAKIKEETGVEVPEGHFKWIRTKKKEYMDVQGEEGEAMFHQEYPSANWQEAFQGSGLCAFNKKKLQIVSQTVCKKPKYCGEIELETDLKTPKVRLYPIRHGDLVPPAKEYGGRLRVWELPQEGEVYYIGSDVALGVIGGDFSVCQVNRIGRRGEPDVQVAEWHGWISPTPFGNVNAALGYWYNEAQVCVECNEMGMKTDMQLFRILEYPNIFRWKHYDKVKNFLSDFLGWYTNSKTRDLIISTMREAIDDGTIILYSEELIEEMIDFAQEEIGARFEGQKGKDDRVMAAMICLFCSHDSDYGQEAAASVRKTPEQKRTEDYANTDFAPQWDQKRSAQKSQDSLFIGNPELLQHAAAPNRVGVLSDYEIYEQVDTGGGSRVELGDLWKLI